MQSNPTPSSHNPRWLIQLGSRTVTINKNMIGCAVFGFMCLGVYRTQTLIRARKEGKKERGESTSLLDFFTPKEKKLILSGMAMDAIGSTLLIGGYLYLKSKGKLVKI